MEHLKDLSPGIRSLDPYLHIDPGFINHRKCLSVFGTSFATEYESKRRPGEGWPISVFNDHLLVDLSLAYCKAFSVRTLGECLSNAKPGMLFCSTETLAGNENVYKSDRVANNVLLPYESEQSVRVEYGTKHIVSDTGRLEQSIESQIAILGELRKVDAKTIVVHPLIMGAPTFDHPWNRDLEKEKVPHLIWHGEDWYQTFPEDIDEFSQMKSIDESDAGEWIAHMGKASEHKVKTSFCDILGDTTKKDWGGEFNDHFSASIHLSGKRLTAAFVFKGPSRFREMTPELLGARADQIYRLAATPAEMLVVQHCHAIGEAVRMTLRRFAVAPHHPRRFCFIDGKDTYKILRAYGKL